MPFGEADTRAKLIDPGLHACGWTEGLIRREETAGAIEIIDGRPRKRARGRVDYVLRVRVNRSLVGRGAHAPGVIERPVLYPDLLIQIVMNADAVLPECLRLVWESHETRQDIESRARTAAGIYKREDQPDQSCGRKDPGAVDRGAATRCCGYHGAVGSGQPSPCVDSGGTGGLAATNALPTALLRKAFAGQL